jgi:hypothetical protein
MSPLADTTNKAITVSAITSPWWLPILHQVSDAAALVLPIIGLLWLLVQITLKLYQVHKGK